MFDHKLVYWNYMYNKTPLLLNKNLKASWPWDNL